MLGIGLDIQFPQKNKEERMIPFGCHKLHEGVTLCHFKVALKPSVKTCRSIIMSNPKLFNTKHMSTVVRSVKTPQLWQILNAAAPTWMLAAGRL